MRFFLRGGKDFSFVRAPRGDGKSICMIPASLSSCYAGRGGKTKTEGLQYLEPKGNVRDYLLETRNAIMLPSW